MTVNRLTFSSGSDERVFLCPLKTLTVNGESRESERESMRR